MLSYSFYMVLVILLAITCKKIVSFRSCSATRSCLPRGTVGSIVPQKKNLPPKNKKTTKKDTLGEYAYNEALIINLAVKTFWKSYLVLEGYKNSKLIEKISIALR